MKHAAKALVMACLSCLALASQETPHLKRSELKDHPFLVSGLQLTITEFVPKTSAGSYLPLFGAAFPKQHITIKVENTSADFQAYAPNDFLLSGKDGQQTTLARGHHDDHWQLPEPTQLAPHGHLEGSYLLTDGLQMPVKIFYRQVLLAEVTGD